MSADVEEGSLVEAIAITNAETATLLAELRELTTEDVTEISVVRVNATFVTARDHLGKMKQQLQRGKSYTK